MIRDLELYKHFKNSIKKISDIIDNELGESSTTKRDYDLCKSIINRYLAITDNFVDDVDEILFDMDISTSNKTAKRYEDFMSIEKILVSAVSGIILEFDMDYLYKLEKEDYEYIQKDQNFNIIIFSMDSIVTLLFSELLAYLKNNEVLEPHNFLDFECDLDFVKMGNLYNIFNKN
jgi:hypothetical protein